MKKEYIAPTLTVVSFKAERGYAASGNRSISTFLSLNFLDAGNDFNSQGQENWEEDNSFGSSW